jgi:hypothetical protein
MPNRDHLELQADAKELIAENGATMQLYKETTTGPSYDPVSTAVTQGVVAVRSKFSAFEVGDGSRIKSTDIKLLLDSDHDPRGYSKVIDGSNEYQIIDVVIVQPGDVVMLYKIQARL